MNPKVVKTVDNEDGSYSVQLSGVRVSYPHIFTPDPKPKFDSMIGKTSCSFIIDKETYNKIAKVVQDAAREIDEDIEFGDISANHRKVSRKKNNDGEVVYALNTSNNEGWLPKYIGADGKVVDHEKAEADKKLYAGSYANIKITLLARKTEYGIIIFSNLIAIQFAEHGDKLGGGGISDEDAMDGFGTVEVQDDFDDAGLDGGSDDEFELDDDDLD